MAFCPEHPKRDQIMKFIPLSETTSIPASMGVSPPPPPPPPLGQRTDRTQCHHFVRMLFFQPKLNILIRFQTETILVLLLNCSLRPFRFRIY